MSDNENNLDKDFDEQHLKNSNLDESLIIGKIKKDLRHQDDIENQKSHSNRAPFLALAFFLVVFLEAFLVVLGSSSVVFSDEASFCFS